jgi:hypothetical protein
MAAAIGHVLVPVTDTTTHPSHPIAPGITDCSIKLVALLKYPAEETNGGREAQLTQAA